MPLRLLHLLPFQARNQPQPCSAVGHVLSLSLLMDIGSVRGGTIPWPFPTGRCHPAAAFSLASGSLFRPNSFILPRPPPTPHRLHAFRSLFVIPTGFVFPPRCPRLSRFSFSGSGLHRTNSPHPRGESGWERRSNRKLGHVVRFEKECRCKVLKGKRGREAVD